MGDESAGNRHPYAVAYRALSDPRHVRRPTRHNGQDPVRRIARFRDTLQRRAWRRSHAPDAIDGVSI